MKKFIFIINLIAFLILSGCSNDTTDTNTEGAENVSAEQSEESSKEKSEVSSHEEEETVEELPEEDTSSEGDIAEEEAASSNLVSYDELEEPTVEYITDIAPNDLSEEIEQNPYDFPVVDEEDMENYVQRFDLDGDGNEEEIKVLLDGTYTGEHPSYILAIYDSRGNPKYAEYQYNAESLDDPMPILTVSELTGDNFLEIIMDSTGGYGFMEGNGDQSISRLVYGFDSDSGNFRQLPVLGSYYDIYWEEDIAVQIDERISGLSQRHDYKEMMGEDLVESKEEHGQFDDYHLQVGQRFVGVPRRVYPEQATKQIESDESFSLAVLDMIHEIPDMSLMSDNLYKWNDTYGWFEVVNSDFSPSGDDTYSFEKPLYSITEFNEQFNAGEAEFEDYLGSWQMVIDGKLQERYLDIGEDMIYETEKNLKDYEQIIEREVTIENYVQKEETGQLIPVGEMAPFLNQPYNASYRNLFTLVKINDEDMLMDRYGHLYVREGEGDDDSEEDGWVYSPEMDSESAAMEEQEPDSSINTSIDVLSAEFMNEYFSGPEPYMFEGIEEGMSQTEIENILGLPDDYYPVGGAEFAIYDNVAILYSQYFPTREGAFEDINPDENYVTRTEVFLGLPHDQMVAAYGEPTLNYDEYPNLGPGMDRTIYDHTRNNGYAIYVEVGTSGTAWLMTKGEESQLVDEYK